jgi:exopolyphosphatase/guanosine-5'-triphosphate,3'-diphosphate pyrophosphatase
VSIVNDGPTTEDSRSSLAAVDLGSNSFRMVIARPVEGGLQMLDRLREGVRLAASLDRRDRLEPEGQERALQALGRFGQRIRHLPQENVRAVGTNTLRKAKGSQTFLERAQEVLGHPIEVISGPEEARLIYLGVAQSLAGAEEQRLVVDIGGGSTELVLGRGVEVSRAESLYMGCVSYSRTHFPEGRLERDRFRAAELDARLEVQPLVESMRRIGWQSAVGSSGTIKAVERVLRENGWSDHGVTLAGMKKLRKKLIKARTVAAVRLDGLSAERAPVLPGGLAILIGIFQELGVERMGISSGALREGLLYDLWGRIRHEDVREETIERFMDLYRVDRGQANRVLETSGLLLAAAAESWSLPPERSRQLLDWAARLHEIGLAVSHPGYHKHGAYLVANADLPGFSRQDQLLLSLLILQHRRKLRRSLLEALPAAWQEPAARLTVLLRLAILLHRARGATVLPSLDVAAQEGRLVLRFSGRWLDRNPLTRADLAGEAGRWKGFGIRLEVGVLDRSA